MVVQLEPASELSRNWLDPQRELLVNHSILPLRADNGIVHIAVADPEDIALGRQLAGIYNSEARIYLADRSTIDDALVRVFREQDKHSIAWSHAETRPSQSASRVMTSAQKVTGGAVVLALGASLALKPLETVVFIMAIITSFYLISAFFKSALALRALSGPCETPVSREEVKETNDADLPCYTVLLPLYREANMLPDLIAAIQRLDYPKTKLDVKLLLEEDDTQTRAAADDLQLPHYFQKLIVPRGKPKGKPRACNYGLLYAKGEYCVIYDAEDQPEPDQLKKAVLAFRKTHGRTSCIQAKLNYYNFDQNLLTKWFTTEYCTWFDLYLPGLNAFNAPIPLGGTSNHFRVDVLRSVGAWDPFNVTEDADLGIRLAREGWQTRVIDSTTYEEANSQLGTWINQRSRWVKGYMQTWLVHMRDPLKLLGEVGPAGFLSIQVMILGTFLAYFINPIMWALLVAWYVARWSGIEAMYPAPLLYASALALFAGNLMLVYTTVMGCLRRGYLAGVKYALLSPFYWLLMSISAWMALYQLILKPFYWEKTPHGLSPIKASEHPLIAGFSRVGDGR